MKRVCDCGLGADDEDAGEGVADGRAGAVDVAGVVTGGTAAGFADVPQPASQIMDAVTTTMYPRTPAPRLIHGG